MDDISRIFVATANIVPGPIQTVPQNQTVSQSTTKNAYGQTDSSVRKPSTPPKTDFGCPPTFSQTEIQSLGNYLQDVKRIGMPRTIDMFLDDCQFKVVFLNKWTTFHNNRPSKSWLKNFSIINGVPHSFISERNLDAFTNRPYSMEQWVSERDKLVRTNNDGYLLHNKSCFFVIEIAYLNYTRDSKFGCIVSYNGSCELLKPIITHDCSISPFTINSFENVLFLPTYAGKIDRMSLYMMIIQIVNYATDQVISFPLVVYLTRNSTKYFSHDLWKYCLVNSVIIVPIPGQVQKPVDFAKSGFFYRFNEKFQEILKARYYDYNDVCRIEDMPKWFCQAWSRMGVKQYLRQALITYSAISVQPKTKEEIRMERDAKQKAQLQLMQYQEQISMRQEVGAMSSSTVTVDVAPGKADEQVIPEQSRISKDAATQTRVKDWVNASWDRRNWLFSNVKREPVFRK